MMMACADSEYQSEAVEGQIAAHRQLTYRRNNEGTSIYSGIPGSAMLLQSTETGPSL